MFTGQGLSLRFYISSPLVMGAELLVLGSKRGAFFCKDTFI